MGIRNNKREVTLEAGTQADDLLRLRDPRPRGTVNLALRALLF